ncbi:hypothetical protein [Caballeronia sp.]
MALDAKAHRVYLVSSKFGPAEAATADNPRPRPTVIFWTAEILVAQRK